MNKLTRAHRIEEKVLTHSGFLAHKVFFVCEWWRENKMKNKTCKMNHKCLFEYLSKNYILFFHVVCSFSFKSFRCKLLQQQCFFLCFNVRKTQYAFGNFHSHHCGSSTDLGTDIPSIEFSFFFIIRFTRE